jgi:hypothetical protein
MAPNFASPKDYRPTKKYSARIAPNLIPGQMISKGSVMFPKSQYERNRFAVVFQPQLPQPFLLICLIRRLFLL